MKKLILAVGVCVCALGAMAAAVDHLVEYVETSGIGSTGNQYVLLDYKPTKNSVIEAEVAFLDKSFNQCFFCSRGNATDTKTFTAFWIGGNGIRWDYNRTTAAYAGNDIAEGDKVSLKFANNGLWINAENTDMSVTPADYAPANKMMLFASYTCAETATPKPTGNYAKMRLYSFKAYDDDGETLKVDLRPCVDSDGNAGLYDFVSGNVYYNKGTTPFVIGNVVRDFVHVSGLPGNFAIDGEPVYGLNVATNGQEFVFAAPEGHIVRPTGTVIRCTGWKLYDWETEGLICESDENNKFLCSLTYESPVNLVWQWEVRAPGAEDDIVIDKAVTVTGPMTCKSLTIKEGGFLKVQAPAAADPKNFATVYPSACKLTVTETFKIERGGTFQPITDVLTGNPVFVNCADFVLEEGGQVEASAMGYGWASQTGVDFAALNALGHVYVKQNDGYSYCPGAGTTYNGTPGYTSAGSRGASSVYGYQYAPWIPGAVSGLYNKYATNEKQWSGWARGGGAVVIFASGKQTIAGDIWANGVWRFYNGSTGGSVWLVANEFKFYSTARLNANGASNASNYNNIYCGGRISLGAGLTAEHVSNLVTGQAPAQVSLACGNNLSFINAHTYKGITATDAMIIDRTRTESGTRTYTVNTNLLTLVAVKGVGVRGADRIGGLLSVDPENPGTIGVEDLKGADESAVHYTASGWRLLDGETEIANGAGQTASWTLAEKYALLTLEWTIVSVEKDPEPDFFADVPAGTGAEKTFVGEDGGDWDEPSNWSPAGVPGLTDLVTLEGKTVCATGVIGAASLTVASDAKLVVGGTGADVLAETAAEGERFGLKVTGDVAIAGQVSFGGKNLHFSTAICHGFLSCKQ